MPQPPIPQSETHTNLRVELQAVQPQLIIGDGGHEIARGGDDFESLGHFVYTVPMSQENLLLHTHVPVVGGERKGQPRWTLDGLIDWVRFGGRVKWRVVKMR